MNSWWIDERAFAGARHVDDEFVAADDAKAQFDPTNDIEVLGAAGLRVGSTVLDLGAGTGVFAITAAELGADVLAVDVSPAMVATLRRRVALLDTGRTDVVEAGFLSSHLGPRRKPSCRAEGSRTLSRVTPTDSRQATTTGLIVGGLVLTPSAPSPEPAAIAWSDGTVDRVEPGPSGEGSPGRTIDADGAWVLPGIIDLHGDAFERSLIPRTTMVDIDLALADNDGQLLAAGITTSFLSVTDGWEPGLRSRETLRQLIDALGRRGRGPDITLHVRHERCATDGLEELEDWIRDGTVQLLSYNDHTPGGIAFVTDIGEGQVRRSGVDRATLTTIREAAVDRRGLGLEQEGRLAVVADAADCPTASHDTHDDVDFRRDLALGVSIAEFPTSIGLARRYHDEGIAVMLGAPNLVRGGSHIDNLSALDAIEAGVGDILCSDYHYPSLLQAPFALAASGAADIGTAWAMVSSAPATAARLTDRGRLTPGARADIVVVEPPDGGPARVRAIVVAGQRVYERG